MSNTTDSQSEPLVSTSGFVNEGLGNNLHEVICNAYVTNEDGTYARVRRHQLEPRHKFYWDDETQKWCDAPKESRMIEQPPMENAFRLNELTVDVTPDGGLALRILKAYRQRCEAVWVVSGLEEERAALYAAMNEHQRQRCEELDQAIALLEGSCYR